MNENIDGKLNKVKILPTQKNSKLPEKTNPEGSVYDVFAHWVEIKPTYIAYGLGFKTEIPYGYEGILQPRSSISKYDLVLANGYGQIDSDFRGEWQMRFKLLPEIFSFVNDNGIDFYTQNNVSLNEYKNVLHLNDPDMSYYPRIYQIGDKIGQIKFQKVDVIPFEVVKSEDNLNYTNRNEGGFGSTGV